jgi:hypothetical protein
VLGVVVELYVVVEEGFDGVEAGLVLGAFL